MVQSIVLAVVLVLSGCAKNKVAPKAKAEIPPAHDVPENPTHLNYGSRQINISHRIEKGDFAIRSFLDYRDRSILYLDHDFNGSFLYRVERENGTYDINRRKKVFEFGKRSFWDPFSIQWTGCFTLFSMNIMMRHLMFIG